VEHQTFCPYKGLCSYYDIGDARPAAWSYREAYPEVGRVSCLVSFEPDSVPSSITNSHLSSGTRGVGPADKTGKSVVRYCPGAAFRLPWCVGQKPLVK
jgi:hypothetical protein